MLFRMTKKKRIGAGLTLAAALAVGGALFALSVGWGSGQEPIGHETNEELAQIAVLDDERASVAIDVLRARGREGHAALLRVHGDAVAELNRGRGDSAAARRLREAIDRVSGQRDGHASGLFWHTDLRDAQAEAARSGRPILSLRLLGRLDDELSCANSRLFRIGLYSHPDVAALLAERYVLHWSSERAAPRITIDLGNGRRVERTIGGNSVHYVMDASGNVVDAIVGLYSPRSFLVALQHSEGAVACSQRSRDRDACLARHHRSELGAMRRRWARGRSSLSSMPTFDSAIASLPGDSDRPAPLAREAMEMTVGKAAIEQPMLDVMENRRSAAVGPRPPEPDWEQIASARFGDVPLCSRTRALIALKTGTDGAAPGAWLMTTAGADGERNELMFRRHIHRWFFQRPWTTRSFETLNRAVYSELMLTPATDPWLGLRPDNVFDALER